MESKPQDYEEQETGWAVSALEVSHFAIAVMLHLRSLSGGGSANSVGPHKSYWNMGSGTPRIAGRSRFAQAAAIV